MNEAILFLYAFIREFKVNIEHALPERPLRMRLMKASPVINNNIENAINELINRNFLRVENNILFLTEEGYNEIYNQ